MNNEIVLGVREISRHVPRYRVGGHKPFGFFHRNWKNNRAHNTVTIMLALPLFAFDKAIAGLERVCLAQGNLAILRDCDCCSNHTRHVLSGIGLGCSPLFYDISIPHLTQFVNEYFVNNKLFFMNKFKNLIINCL